MTVTKQQFLLDSPGIRHDTGRKVTGPVIFDETPGKAPVARSMWAVVYEQHNASMWYGPGITLAVRSRVRFTWYYVAPFLENCWVDLDVVHGGPTAKQLFAVRNEFGAHLPVFDGRTIRDYSVELDMIGTFDHLQIRARLNSLTNALDEFLIYKTQLEVIRPL